MAVVFGDSFNGYNTLLLKWSSGSSVAYNTDPAFIRTGNQSFLANGESFASLPRINFASRSTMIMGVAIYFTGLATQVYKWLNSQGAPSGGELISIQVGSDGAINVGLGNGPTIIAVSAPGVVSAGSFSYLETKVTFDSVAGSCVVRVNGQVVVTFNGPTCFAGFANAQSFTLTGSSHVDLYYSDFYLLDDSGGVNDDFLGPIQVFAIVPDANETPLDWTPLANTNWQEVSQVPPPVDDSAYVFAGTEGNTDQYHYTISGPTEAFEIKFVQHSLCCKLDAPGAHTIASQVNTHTSGAPQVGSDAVGADYVYVIFPWDVNPNTGVPFIPSDFASTFFGPKITS